MTIESYLSIVSKHLNFRMGYSRKKTNRGCLRYTFLKPPPPLEFLNLLLYPQKFRRKQAFTHGYSAKLCDTNWKFQVQKLRPMEIPHEFFLNTTGNSTSFLIDPRISTCSFFNSPGNSMSSTPTPFLDFFWNSPISGQHNILVKSDILVLC